MQRWQNASDLARSSDKSYSDSLIETDSGIELDRDYPSTTDLNSSYLASAESIPSITTPTPTKHVSFVERSTADKSEEAPPAYIRFPFDGLIERIRPATMRNSDYGDYIVCRTNRGEFIAYRTPLVPQWVTDLVNEIEAQQR